jgi:hypothetical protein
MFSEFFIHPLMRIFGARSPDDDHNRLWIGKLGSHDGFSGKPGFAKQADRCRICMSPDAVCGKWRGQETTLTMSKNHKREELH